MPEAAAFGAGLTTYSHNALNQMTDISGLGGLTFDDESQRPICWVQDRDISGWQ
jgi:hypothetical protein